VRDLDVIASELRLVAAIRRTAAEVGAPAPRTEVADRLLDEWPRTSSPLLVPASQRVEED
jgi:hypothetical protein